MNKYRKSTWACFLSLLFVTFIAGLGGCATERYVGYHNVGSNGPDCDKTNRKPVYTVVVLYEKNGNGDSCPVDVSFLQGDNGCREAPVAGDKYPPVCLCVDKGEALEWVANTKVAPDNEFAIHFSPFKNGSFESDQGAVKPQKIVSIKKGPKTGDQMYFEYSITAGDACEVVDPPVIIKK